VQFEVRLRDAIAYATAARGDPVHAIVASDVKRAGRVIIPKSAVLTGRITRITSYTNRSAVFFGIGLRFDAIEFDGRRGEFSGIVDSAGVGNNYYTRAGEQPGESFVAVKATLERFERGTRLLIRAK